LGEDWGTSEARRAKFTTYNLHLFLEDDLPVFMECLDIYHGSKPLGGNKLGQNMARGWFFYPNSIAKPAIQVLA